MVQPAHPAPRGVGPPSTVVGGADPEDAHQPDREDPGRDPASPVAARPISAALSGTETKNAISWIHPRSRGRADTCTDPAYDGEPRHSPG